MISAGNSTTLLTLIPSNCIAIPDLTVYYILYVMLIVLKSKNKDLNHSRNTSRSYSAPSYDLCLPRPEQTTDYLKILLGSSV